MSSLRAVRIQETVLAEQASLWGSAAKDEPAVRWRLVDSDSLQPLHYQHPIESRRQAEAEAVTMLMDAQIEQATLRRPRKAWGAEAPPTGRGVG